MQKQKEMYKVIGMEHRVDNGYRRIVQTYNWAQVFLG